MHTRGIYRSEATSCMNNNIPYYSAISRQAIVERIKEYAGEEFTLESFYALDKDDFGPTSKASSGAKRNALGWSFGVDPKLNKSIGHGPVYKGMNPNVKKIENKRDMKKFIYIILIGLVALSCSKSQAPENNQMEFMFSIGNGTTKVTSTAFEAGDAVSLYAVEWDGNEQYPIQVSGNYLNNEKITYNGTSWTSLRILYWSDNPCDFYALYPYQSSITSIEKQPFSVAWDQSGAGYEASDLLYHLLVMLTEKGLRIEDVAAELQQRHDPNWDKKRREAKAAGKMK